MKINDNKFIKDYFVILMNAMNKMWILDKTSFTHH